VLASVDLLSDSLADAADSALQQCAAALDDRGVTHLSEGDAPSKLPDLESPHILSEFPRLCVLWKPSGWTVSVTNDDDGPVPATIASDGESLASDESSVTWSGDGLRLQDWVGTEMGRRHPIALDPGVSYGLLHRLDRDTSGGLLWAKNYGGYFAARMQFITRRVRKCYVCLCEGFLPPEPRFLTASLVQVGGRQSRGAEEGHARSLSYEEFLAGGGRGEGNATSSNKPRSAKTEVCAVAHLLCPDGLRASLVEIRLHTGRLHQIRAHLSLEGHPLLGDSLYGRGRPKEPLLEASEKSWQPPSRTCLHAASLGLALSAKDSGTSNALDATAPLPADIRQAIADMTPVQDGGWSEGLWRRWLER
ncbi:unnamed protein product, partial [Polarella glacialis]